MKSKTFAYLLLLGTLFFLGCGPPSLEEELTTLRLEVKASDLLAKSKSLQPLCLDILAQPSVERVIRGPEPSTLLIIAFKDRRFLAGWYDEERKWFNPREPANWSGADHAIALE